MTEPQTVVRAGRAALGITGNPTLDSWQAAPDNRCCLLYTSDAADD